MPRRVSKTPVPLLALPRADTSSRGARVVTADELGQVLRWMRGMRGATQLDDASSLGVSPELLRGLEKGDRGVRLGTAMEVLARVGIDVVLVPRDPELSLQPPDNEQPTAPHAQRRTTVSK